MQGCWLKLRLSSFEGSKELNPIERIIEPTLRESSFLVSLKLIAPEGQIFSQIPHLSLFNLIQLVSSMAYFKGTACE